MANERRKTEKDVDPMELSGDAAHLEALHRELQGSQVAEEPKSRPDRKEVTKRQRRRRTTFGIDSTKKLFVPEHMKDPNFHYRWINATGNRLQLMTQEDDYDIVCEEDAKNEKDVGEGTAVKRAVGTNKAGEPIYAYLCRKPKEFYEEDQKAKQQPVDESEEALRRGDVKTPGGQADKEAFYTPGGSNTVGPQPE